MNQYLFKVSTGKERDAREMGVEVRADNIIDALRKMEALVLQKEKEFSLTMPIGGRIIQIEKIE